MVVDAVAAVLVLLAALPASAQPRAYPWMGARAPARTVESAIPPPAGFHRAPAPPGSFADWLRGLPLKPQGTPVHLYDGRLKADQGVHHAVADLDVGSRDLQQCADAVIRLRAEYLWSRGRAGAIAFNFTDGFRAGWQHWADGWRPRVGRPTAWVKAGAPDASRTSFKRYLDEVMNYAGTLSLSRELVPRAVARIRAGDVLVQGGSPGHAVLVVDTAEDAAGNRVLIIGQSYMPAQEFHVLKNTGEPAISPWYRADRLAGPGLVTAEWPYAFRAGDLRGFDTDEGDTR